MKRTPKKRRYTDDFIAKLAKKLEVWIGKPDSDWLGDFAAENRMSRQRLSEIAEANEGFREVYEYAKQVQENKLFRLGLDKGKNASMSIFALKNVAGWRDTHDITSGGEKITEVKVSIIQAK